MTLTLAQTASAVAPNCFSVFGASGGTSPYTYAASGAGGSVDPSSGLYHAPPSVPQAAGFAVETVTVTDALGATATATLTVGGALILLCDILQTTLGLATGRVYLWDQKLMQPTDTGLYVAVSVVSERLIGVSTRFNPATGSLDQYAAAAALIDIDLLSRDASARDLRQAAVLALSSTYAQQQMAANSFTVGSVPAQRLMNLSNPDGSAIPYRFKITAQMQYAYSQSTQATGYYDNFPGVPVTTDGGSATGATVSGGNATPPLSDTIDGGGP